MVINYLKTNVRRKAKVIIGRDGWKISERGGGEGVDIYYPLEEKRGEYWGL